MNYLCRLVAMDADKPLAFPDVLKTKKSSSSNRREMHNESNKAISISLLVELIIFVDINIIKLD